MLFCSFVTTLFQWLRQDLEKILVLLMQFSLKWVGIFFFIGWLFFLCSVLCYPSGSVEVCVSMMQNFISQTDGTVTADAREYVKVTQAVV